MIEIHSRYTIGDASPYYHYCSTKLKPGGRYWRMFRNNEYQLIFKIGKWLISKKIKETK